MRQFSALLVLTMALASCNRDDGDAALEPLPGKVAIDIAALTGCHKNADLDSADITQQILGLWRWWATQCFWSGVGEVKSDVRLQFARQGDLTIKTDGATSHHKWSLQKSASNQWRIEVEPVNSAVYGLTFLCGDSLLFYTSFIDGCDNLFVRMK